MIDGGPAGVDALPRPVGELVAVLLHAAKPATPAMAIS
ncbi:hypothetical protein MMMB2_0987 [Mycobacterium marinum MB2]|nr:hypothetical protein MMMB2_0987 [Mycobacterium marinum MB2]